MRKYKIKNHSIYKKAPFYYEAIGTNVSSITDKLVRDTGQITERYAGDIVYDIMNLLDAVNHGLPSDKLLCMDEDGVKSFDISKELIDDGLLEYVGEPSVVYAIPCIRAWRLTHEPNENHKISKTILRRVDIDCI